jgi:hypothetical protein
MLGPLKKLYKALDGLKTLLFGGVTLLLYLADQWEMIDLTPVLTMLFGEDYGTKLAANLTVAFLLLRIVSNSGIKLPWNRKNSRDTEDDDQNREPF